MQIEVIVFSVDKFLKIRASSSFGSRVQETFTNGDFPY